MKKIFNGAVVLLFFGMALTIVELACQKTVANVPVIGFDKLVYYKRGPLGSELWTCNFDGSEDKKIPIQLPANYQIIAGDSAPVQRSTDGQRFAFVAVDFTLTTGEYPRYEYTCKIDGTDLRLIKAINGIPSITYVF